MIDSSMLRLLNDYVEHEVWTVGVNIIITSPGFNLKGKVKTIDKRRASFSAFRKTYANSGKPIACIKSETFETSTDSHTSDFFFKLSYPVVLHANSAK